MGDYVISDVQVFAYNLQETQSLWHLLLFFFCLADRGSLAGLR